MPKAKPLKIALTALYKPKLASLCLLIFFRSRLEVIAINFYSSEAGIGSRILGRGKKKKKKKKSFCLKTKGCSH